MVKDGREGVRQAPLSLQQPFLLVSPGFGCKAPRITLRSPAPKHVVSSAVAEFADIQVLARIPNSARWQLIRVRVSLHL